MTNNIPGDLVFEDWTVTILNDINHVGRQLFATWQNEFANFVTNDRADFHSAKRNATLAQLGADGNELPGGVGKYLLTGLYPKSVGEIAYGHDNVDSLEEISIIFGVDFWAKA